MFEEAAVVGWRLCEGGVVRGTGGVVSMIWEVVGGPVGVKITAVAVNLESGGLVGQVLTDDIVVMASVVDKEKETKRTRYVPDSSVVAVYDAVSLSVNAGRAEEVGYVIVG